MTDFLSPDNPAPDTPVDPPAQDVPLPEIHDNPDGASTGAAPVEVVENPVPEADPHLAPVETSQPGWDLEATPAETLEPEVTHVTAETDEGQAILHAAALGIVSEQHPDLSDEELGEAVQRYIDMNANTLLPALRATLAVKATEVPDGA